MSKPLDLESQRWASTHILPLRELVSVPAPQGHDKDQTTDVRTALNTGAWHTTSSQGMSDAICFLSSLKLGVVVAVVGVIGVAVVIVVNSGKITPG